MTAQLLASALVTGMLYALIAVSLNLIYGTMRVLNLAHGDLSMIGAFTAYWAFSLGGISPIISIFIAAALTAGFGVLVYKGLVTRIFRKARNLDRIEANSLLIFYGLSIVLENLATYWFSGTPRGYDYFNEIIHVFGVSLAANRLVTLGVALVAISGVLLFFRFSIWGMAVRALIQNRDASSLMGIDLDRVFMLAIALGFGLAGIAGVLDSMQEAVTPFMGLHFTIAAFVIIILGGLGNLIGSAVGGILLGLLETFGIAVTGPNYRSILIYGVFIVILILRPQGLFGSKVQT